jgi:putative tricarboxylic transport membrane protein
VRRFEIATAAVMIAIAAVAMFDSRAGALIDTSGKSPGGIGPGFYPFWASAVVAVAALSILYRAAVAADRPAGPRLFENREAVVSVAKLVGPMLVVTAALSWLGFYLSCGLYMGFFARYFGRYRWLWVAVIAVAFPAAAYLAFEMGFRVRLPKSALYELGFLF